ncbi:YbjP/YqhG family protein [Klebsiella pneumoniae]|uniref:YbjP/YqhG family protein n=1 Tax=Klebsiella pneumoniae TaxID=573 RepID=UPI002180A71D|nr:YbjP/YqhG family protein [Klebsiella pneumoniae]MDW6138434.1 YbjP/YqhG family protein [Klebsiella pneumoniae]
MMDPLIPHMRNVFLFAFLLCLSNFTQASEQTSPENIVYNFYKSYLKEESSDNSRLLSQYVSDELMKSINDSMMCNYDSDDSVSAEELEGKCSQKRECKQFKGRYICNWHGAWVDTDVDYFTKSQDVYPSWKASISTFDVYQKENDSSVNVILGAGSEPKVKFNVVLEKIDRKWKNTSVTEQ